MTERHLILQESVLLPSSEWTLRNHGWLMARVSEGVGYWMQPGVAARELAAGDGFVVGHNSTGVLRASQLGPLKLQFFVIQPQHLNGLLAVTEWHQLEVAPNNLSSHVSLFTAGEPIGQKFARISNQSPSDKLPVRCALLQLWANAMADLLSAPAPSTGGENKLRERFRRLVGRMTEAELSECSLAELAGELHCSERHFSRLFREEFGVPLRARQIELRLQRARQLLAETDAKIINVAYDSGYRHLGLFNTMFKKRFGMTPGEWRQQNAKKAPSNGARPSPMRSPAAVLALIAGIFFLVLRGPAQDALTPDGVSMAQAREALLQKMAELDEADRKPKVHVVPATTNGPHFKVNRYLVMGNSVLPPAAIGGVVTNVPSAFGTNVSFEDVRALLGDLQMAYRERGFVTVSVGLPQQKLTNGEVKVQVTEGRVTAINVVGNRYYSSNNVMRALPDLSSGLLLNSHVFQRELDAANASRDRQIYPVIGPGPDPGTTELTLKVKDRYSLHARIEVNNQATPNTPELRVNGSIQYDNLWDREHQVGLQYSCAFQKYRQTSTYAKSPLDDPLIANYSGYYRMPFGGYRSVQEQLDAAPGRFGYSEVTHQFTMPPNITGRPELTVYASRSATDTGVQRGPTKVLVDSNSVNSLTGVRTETLLLSDSAGQNLSVNENVGLKFSLPVPELAKVSSVLSFGADLKHYRLTSFNTNENFFKIRTFDPRSIDPNVPVSEDVFAAPQPFPPTFAALDYLPLNLGWSGSRAGDAGKTFFNATLNFNALRILSDDRAFAASSYSTNAKAGYVTLQLGVDRIQNLGKDWTLKLHADGQWADGPLFSNEQFGMGGVGGARGYTDGEAYGDSGWRLSIEPQSPPFNIGSFGNEGHTEPCWLRASAFLDYGEIYLADQVAAAGLERRQFLGAGTALSVNIGTHIDARMTVAWPLLTDSTPLVGSSAGNVHVYFGLGAQF